MKVLDVCCEDNDVAKRLNEDDWKKLICEATKLVNSQGRENFLSEALILLGLDS